MITSAFRRCLPRLVRPLLEWWAWIRLTTKLCHELGFQYHCSVGELLFGGSCFTASRLAALICSAVIIFTPSPERNRLHCGSPVFFVGTCPASFTGLALAGVVRLESDAEFTFQFGELRRWHFQRRPHISYEIGKQTHTHIGSSENGRLKSDAIALHATACEQ